jgi:biopolymer transport protein ExbD
MRLPGAVRLGLFALFIGFLIYGPTYYWVNTRTWIPIDIPVSLAPGHIRTGDFKINFESFFSARITFSDNADYSTCSAIDLRTTQPTYVGGNAIAVFGGLPSNGVIYGNVTGGYLGTFHGKPGRYSLDVEVLSQTKGLDRCHPRLVIDADSADYFKWSQTLDECFSVCVFCEFLGIMILLVFATTYFRKEYFEELRLRIFTSDPPSTALIAVKANVERSIHWLMICGMFALVAGIGIFAATKRWYETRGLVPVDMPVSLGKGHIETGAFAVKRGGTYHVALDLQSPNISGCPEYEVLKTRWVLTQNNQVVARSDHGENYLEKAGAPIGGYYFGDYFEAAPGTYNLELEVLSDASCLNAGKPHLRVSLSDYDRAEFDYTNAKLQLVALLVCGAGFAFFIAYWFAWARRTSGPESPGIHSRNVTPAWGVTGLRHRRFFPRRGWSTNPVVNTPTISLICTVALFTCFMSAWLACGIDYQEHYGLMVSLSRKGVPVVTQTPGLTAPLIRIDAKGQVYLNYKKTTWEELPAGVDQALRGLPVRVVYFDADENALFMDAARAIDISEGARAKVILMTPGTKRQTQDPGS